LLSFYRGKIYITTTVLTVLSVQLSGIKYLHLSFKTVFRITITKRNSKKKNPHTNPMEGTNGKKLSLLPPVLPQDTSGEACVEHFSGGMPCPQ
jgi:hypothetical protein